MKWLIFSAVLGLSHLASQDLRAECQDTEFEIVENLSNPQENGRVGTMLLRCHGGELKLPEILSMHFAWEEGGKLCMKTLNSCGNIDRMKVGISVDFKFKIVDFKSAIEIFNKKFKGSLEVTPQLAFEYEQLRNYCKDYEMEPLCI